MQRLCAPSRQDIDQAHLNGRHLDIGAQSLRNLANIGPKRTIIWLLLGASSFPLHLV